MPGKNHIRQQRAPGRKGLGLFCCLGAGFSYLPQNFSNEVPTMTMARTELQTAITRTLARKKRELQYLHRVIYGMHEELCMM